MDYKAQWYTSKNIRLEDSAVEIKQVYVWLYTKDKCLIIVSKNGEKWQLPGGHPKIGESIKDTVVREVKEETGLDISRDVPRIEFFGYYDVKSSEEGIIKESFLQVRTFLRLEANSTDLILSAKESDEELEEDKVKFVKAYGLDKVFELIPWLKTKDEYLSLNSTGVLS